MTLPLPVVSLLVVGTVVATLCSADKTVSYHHYDLGGKQWSVINANKSIHLDGTCSVPGDIYGDLMNNGVIGNPFYRYGDELDRWIAYENWTYYRNFEVPASAAGSRKSVLVIEGMQVVTNIYIGEKFIGNTTDEFQKYQFDVTDVLAPLAGSKATITVAFTSSVAYATQRFREYPHTPKPNAPAYLTGLPHRNFIRAEQSSFGWDWSPAFAPQGIYKPIYLRVFSNTSASGAKIQHVTPHMFPLPFNQSVKHPLSDSNNSFLFKFYIYFTAATAEAINLVATIHAPSLGCHSTKSDVVASTSTSEQFIRMTHNHSNLELWWPHGYGKQTLHTVEVELRNKDTDELLDFASIRLGVRSMELITFGDPLKYKDRTTTTATTSANHHHRDDLESIFVDLDQNGKINTKDIQEKAVVGEADLEVKDRPVMFFRVNGVPIFAKGANLVPFDAFQSRVNNSFMEDILDSAIDANMNMIRVWGGGLFPLDDFYRMADEKGILLWQEMIFACAQYPIDAFFLEEVRSEIQYQMRRLGQYSAIAIWSGNNENGIYDKGPGSPYEILDYDNVMYEVIRQDTSRPVWPSSPSTGYAYGVTPSGLPAGTMEKPLPFKVGGDSGDSHYYNYFSCPNVTLYPKTNFGSEYGFQSLPWFPNFERISEPEDWSLFSPFMNHRQHHPNGNAEIAALLRQNFQVPDLNSTALDVFKRVIYLSQIQQTLCIADEGSYYRRGRNMPYRTMGSLYWQLNQNWEAPSWTSIDFGGVWKVLHYAMRDVYASIHISSFYNQTTDEVVSHIASDELNAIPDVILTIELIPFDVSASDGANATKFVIETLALNEIPALSGVFFWSMSRTKLLRQNEDRCPHGGASCFLWISARNAEGKPLTTSQPFWLTYVKDFKLNNKTSFAISEVHLQSSSHVTFQLAASHVSPYTVIQTDDYYGRFSDNGIVVIPGRPLAMSYQLRRLQSKQGYRPRIENVTEFQSTLYLQCLNQMWSS